MTNTQNSVVQSNWFGQKTSTLTVRKGLYCNILLPKKVNCSFPKNWQPNNYVTLRVRRVFYIIFQVLHNLLDSLFVLNCFCRGRALEEILVIFNFSGSKLIQAVLRGPSPSFTDFSSLMHYPLSWKFYYLNLRVFISFASIAFLIFYTLDFTM